MRIRGVEATGGETPRTWPVATVPHRRRDLLAGEKAWAAAWDAYLAGRVA